MLNNIKSLKVLKIVMELIEKGIELNLFKYNKKMQDKLNIQKKDFKEFTEKQYELLNRLKNILKVNITDFNIKILAICHKRYFYYRDIEKYLSKIKFKFREIEELNLSYNSHLTLYFLRYKNLEKLKVLNFSKNNVYTLNAIQHMKLINLKVLNLSKNIIEVIDIFGKINLKNLEKLDLSENRISDINVLEKTDFNDLKDLFLNDNLISDIKVLDKVKFKKLEKLN